MLRMCDTCNNEIQGKRKKYCSDECGRLGRDPWEHLLKNVCLSGRYGSKGGSFPKTIAPHLVHITAADLQNKFNEQGQKCYWFGIKLNPKDIFIPRYPLALSVDRLDNSKEYSIDNIVICSRLANLGRGSYPADKFYRVVDELIESIRGYTITSVVENSREEQDFYFYGSDCN